MTETASFRKDDVVEVTIEDIGQDGEGIGHGQGGTLFIKDAVIGDTVEAKVMKAKKNYAFARLLSVKQPSPWRVTPRCAIADKCGGCQIQALRYDKQLEFKQNKVENDLIRIGSFPKEEIAARMHPIIGMADPWHYRNKAQLPVGRNKEGRLIAGFYAGRTHVIIPVSSCEIGAEENSSIITAVLDWMEQYQIPPYDEAAGKGLVRHILIRTGIYSGQVMVCLVVNCPKNGLPHTRELVERLSVLPGMASISLNINRERTNVILGQELVTLWGTDTIQDSLSIFQVTYGKDGMAAFTPAPYPAVRFHISPLSFYQVNPRQTEKLYSLVLAFAGLTGRETVWDLYCGVGTISLFLARFAGKVYGVEVIPAAVEDARQNAARNGVENARFQAGKVEDVLPAYVRQRQQEGDEAPVDVVVVDPPRKGCDRKCLDTILEVQPQRVIYVSCDPATLARDLRILCDGGYTINQIQPVDQFSHTVHVEVVCSMSRRS